MYLFTAVINPAKLSWVLAWQSSKHAFVFKYPSLPDISYKHMGRAYSEMTPFFLFIGAKTSVMRLVKSSAFLTRSLYGQYSTALCDHADTMIAHCRSRCFPIQQDSAPSHRAHATKEQLSGGTRTHETVDTRRPRTAYDTPAIYGTVWYRVHRSGHQLKQRCFLNGSMVQLNKFHQ